MSTATNIRCLLALGLGLGITPLCPAQNMFRADAARTGVNASAAPRQAPRVKWRFPTGGRIVSSPAVADGVIYFGSDDGNVYAVDAATGRQIWKRATKGPVSSSPAVVDGVVYVQSYDGKFYAIDAKTGDLKWKFASSGERRFEAKGLHGMQPKNQTIADPFDVYLSSPLVVQGSVYFGCGDGNVYALDAVTGDLKWKFQTGDVVHASPALANGILYIGSWDSFLYAIEAATGKEKWRFQGGEDPMMHNQVGFQSSAAVVDGVVYVGCRDSHLYAVDAATGQEKWKFNNEGSWVISSPAVAQGRVYFATSDSSLYHVVDATDGKSLLRKEGKAYVFASPTIAGDVVLLGVLNGTLEARDLKTGEVLWEFRTETSKQNRGWVLTAEGRINSPLLATSSWREAPIVAADRQFNIGAIFSSPLADQGVVYFGSTDGYLYALE